MSKNKKKILIIGGVCLLIAIVVVAVVLMRGAGKTPSWNINRDPVTGETILDVEATDEAGNPVDPTTTKPATENSATEATTKVEDEATVPTTGTEEPELPPVVEIPDPDPEETGLQFPCEIPGYNLKIEKLAPYNGLFVEDGSNVEVENVAMLLVRNEGDKPVEYTEITVTFAQETLHFQITALPAGAKVVVQEKNGKSIPSDTPQKAEALVVRRADLSIAPEISVTDNGDNSLTIKNLTDQTIPTVRVFYKYYLANEDMYVGGIAFTVRITQLQAKSSLVVKPAHFVSETSRIVMALTYDSEA